jgi:TRAP-type C4-dicarboxylate transport system permease small subunit
MHNKLLSLIDAIIGWWCILVMGAMTLLVIASVVLRYVFGLTWVWSEELITFLFISSTFFGCVIASRKNEHISVDFLPVSLKGIKQKILMIIISVAVITVQLVILKFSLQWISVAGAVPSPGFGIPLKMIYLCMPISSGLIVFYELIKIFAYVSGGETKAGV